MGPRRGDSTNRNSNNFRFSTRPSRELQAHIMRGGITLDELFVDGRGEAVEGEFLAKMRMVARYRLIGVFVHATHPGDKKGVDNSIIGCGGSVGALVRHATAHMQHAYGFVRGSDLPAQYTHLNEHWKGMVKEQARTLLLTEALLGTDRRQSEDVIDGVLGTHVLYDDTHGLWVAGKSFLDEYKVLRCQIAEAVTPKQLPKKKRRR